MLTKSLVSVEAESESTKVSKALAFKYHATVDAQIRITNKEALGKVLDDMKKKISTLIQEVNEITPEYLARQRKKMEENCFDHFFLHFNFKFSRIKDDYFNRVDMITNAIVKDMYTNTTQWIKDDDMMKLSLLYILECGILGKESHSEIKMEHVNMNNVVATLDFSISEENMLTTSELDHNVHYHARSAGDDAEPLLKRPHTTLKRPRTTITHQGGEAHHSISQEVHNHSVHQFEAASSKQIIDYNYIISPSMEDEDVIYSEYVNKEEVVNKEKTEVVNKWDTKVVNKKESEAINKKNEAIINEDNEDVNMEEKKNEPVNNQDNEDVNKQDKTNEATNKDNNVNKDEDTETMV
ncbi:hypothetical protein FNV43_RR24480 [Rhamnella rubrinervis]|uniref:Uncharacterized protein n=1 Tax=Rhamnella rubrinervis TaxID=2594499 RepID=A0A8K0GQR4_9ROSA|nr:hypothetical protein FNV43_RR24480 [Rhamnella rubrinervis]